MPLINPFEMTHALFGVSVTHVIAQRVTSSWPWYVIRAAGFVSAALLILLMLSGIGQVTGLTYRFVEPIKAWLIHKALAIALCVGIAIHGGFLLIDHFVPFSLAQVTVPFLTHYNNGSKLLGIGLGGISVALGIFASYGVAILVLTSLGWIDSKTRLWRTLHYTSYAVAILVFLHATYTGTDLRYGLFRAVWVGLGVLVVFAIASRLWRAGMVKKHTRLQTPGSSADTRA